ncbi:hypothetical protein JM93_03813 [Roseibium hamelinense]|uniref:ChrR-like cupin domain-containing protein n=1 Tax=Roseibium hamelinense TaxID=150831 RepID=A0A562SKN1_9HYPH|nr:hypothetical protein [Roseibium hamelinense]MTI43222.1 hypothetical protein [Roseibium hamelinense]TWI81851.1 hypothetical protein JM93_03813 [Roseibium hamelinense]
MLMLSPFKSLLAAAGLIAFTALAQAGGSHGDGHIFKFEDVAWEHARVEGVEMAILWGNEADETAVSAFRIQPGASIPPHTHTNDYWGLAVQGTWVHIDADGQEMRTGQDAYGRIKGGDLHADRCAGPEVCINILDFDGARDIAFPE